MAGAHGDFPPWAALCFCIIVMNKRCYKHVSIAKAERRSTNLRPGIKSLLHKDGSKIANHRKERGYEKNHQFPETVTGSHCRCCDDGCRRFLRFGSGYLRIHSPANITSRNPGFSGVGPVVSGSVDFSKIPSNARKFLQKHCDGHAVVKCDKTYSTGDFSLALADGIEMEFDAKGNLTEISAPENYSLAPTLLKAVIPGKLYKLLDHNGFKACVEGVCHDKSGYSLRVADPVFDQVRYDPSGVLTLIVDK